MKKVTNLMTQWFTDGVLDREDGPAIEWTDGNKTWYKSGLIHREDGPAVLNKHGDVLYLIDGRFSREDGPAKIFKSGRKDNIDSSIFSNAIIAFS